MLDNVDKIRSGTARTSVVRLEVLTFFIIQMKDIILELNDKRIINDGLKTPIFQLPKFKSSAFQYRTPIKSSRRSL